MGKGIGYFVNGDQGSHAMTIVGYNDAIWTDVNGNSVIDPGEKGAFKIANSWGSSWQDAGFVWIAYDALRTESALPDGPSDNRHGGFQGDMVFVLAARDDYSPSMIAEFTVNHARRAQMALSLGISNLAATSPATQWSPAAFANKGGLYAFDGTTTAVDGTFYLDFTDLLTVTGISRKFYLGLRDNASPYPATLSAFKIIDLTTDPETEAGSVTSLPIYADGSPDASFAFTQYTFAGDTVNHPPALSYMVVNPPVGTVTDSYYYQVNYVDEDGDRAAIKNLYIDGVAYEMEEYAEAPGWFYYYATLSLGTHNFRFYFTDSRGGSVSEPVSGTYSGPIVTLSHYVIEPATPTGDADRRFRDISLLFGCGRHLLERPWCPVPLRLGRFDGLGLAPGWAGQRVSLLVERGRVRGQGPGALRLGDLDPIGLVRPARRHGRRGAYRSARASRRPVFPGVGSSSTSARTATTPGS